MVFVGGGEDFDAITALADKYELHDECIFTGPIRNRETLRAFYSRADLFLFPSTFDTSGLAVLEAAACGLASLLTCGSAAAEPATDGKNAVLIDEDADSLARAVIELLKNREYLKELGSRAADDLYVPWEVAVTRACERYGEILYEKTR